MAGGGVGVLAQAVKRVPRIKFPQRRRPAPSESTDGQLGEVEKIFFSELNKSTNVSLGGKVSLLPKRTPMSADEIEAILLGGCF